MADSRLKGFYKVLFSISIPIILQQFLQTFVNMLDTVMIGTLGKVPLGAVGLGNQIFFILNMVLFGIASGGSVFISQFWGKNEIKGIRQTLGISLVLAIIFSLVFMLAAIFVPDMLLGFYSEDQAVILEGSRYLRIVAFSYPIMAISFVFQIAFRSTEHVVLPTVSTALSFVLNVVFNYVLIFRCSLGVEGAAIATVISRSVEFILCIGWAYHKKFEVCGSIKEFLSFTRIFVGKLIKIGLPVMISETCWGLGISVQNGIFSHVSTDYYAAFNISNTINQLTWVFFIGIGSAAGIILGKKIGAGDIDGTKAYAHRFCWFYPLCGLLMGFLLFPLSMTLESLFNVETDIIEYARQILLVLVFTYPLRAYNMLTIVGIFRAGGDTLYASVIDNVWAWFVALPLGYVASAYFDAMPWVIFICLETEQFLKALFGAFRVKSGKWLKDVTSISSNF